MTAYLTDVVRARLLALIKADIGQDGSPFVEAFPGPRSTELDIVVHVHGNEADGLIAMAFRERKKGLGQ